MDDHLKWKIKKDETLITCKIFDLQRSTRESANGKTGDFYILSLPQWASVVPVLKNDSGVDCFLMVKQFRHGVQKIIYEFPAGIVEPGEPPEHTASRELLEETGYKAGKITLIGRIHPCPAFMTNTSFTYIAQDLEYKGEQQLDSHEMVDTVIMPVKEVEDSINKGAKGFSNSQTIVSFHWYTQYISKIKSQINRENDENI